MLYKRLLPLNFAQGIDTKTDDFQLDLGQFTRAENVIFETIKSFRKRNGYDKLSTTERVVDNVASDESDVEIDSPEFVSSFKNELVLTNASSFYTRSPQAERFYKKGTIYPIRTTIESITANTIDYDAVDAIVVNNTATYVYRKAATGEYFYSVVDLTSGTILVAEKSIGVYDQISLGFIANTVYIFTVLSADLSYRTFDVTSPVEISLPVSVASDVETVPQGLMDVASAGNKIIVVYNSDAVSNKLALFSIDQDNNVSSLLNITGSGDAVCMNTYVDSLNRIVFSWYDGTSVFAGIFAFNLAGANLSPVTLETVADVVNIAAVETSVGTYKCFYEISAASDSNHYIRANTFTTTGSAGTAATVLRSVGLAGKAIPYGSGLIPIVHDSALQPTDFLMDPDGNIAAKLLQSTSGGLRTVGVLPNSLRLSQSDYLVPLLQKLRILAVNGTFFSPLTVAAAKLELDSLNFQETAVLGNALFVSGGILKSYDGNTLSEAGFHLYPETITAGATATTGGSMSNGNYGYQAVYMWIDKNGQEHRSAPSAVLSRTLSGGGSTQTSSIVIPTLRVTDKENVIIELYRTENNGTIFYKVTSVLTPTPNDKTVDTVTITDIISDSQLLFREPLYTTGDVLENIAPPAANIVASHTASNRIFYLGQNPNTLLYSKIANFPLPVEFNDTLQLTVDPIGGSITALAAMDEKLVIFKEDAILYISGRGPNNLGQQDDFSLSERISIETGCINKRSVVLTPSGLMFQSRKGIYLLTRSLGLNYIGAAVEKFNQETITSAKIVPEVNQVRFTTSNDTCLVYNYLLNLWCTFTNHGALSAEILANDYYYVRTNGELFKENKISFSDAGTSIKMVVESGWINFAPVLGFQRVYKFMLLAKYKSMHFLKVRFAYNYTNAYTQEATVTPSNFTSDEKYGDVSPYGEEETYGAANSYRVRVNTKQQKCDSIRFIIEEEQDAVGEGLSLHAATFEVGTKSGVTKLGAGRRYAAS